MAKMKWTDLGISRPGELNQDEADALDRWGLLYLNKDKNRMETTLRDMTVGGILTSADHADEHDVVVDSTYNGSNTNIVGTIQAALDADHISVLVKSAGDSVAIDWLDADTTQLIEGKDADTVLMPQDLTLNKVDATLVEIGFDSTALTFSSNRAQARECLFTGTSTVVVDSGAQFSALIQPRFITRVAATSQLTLNDGGSDFLLQSGFYINNGGLGSEIEVLGDFSRFSVQGSFFIDPGGSSIIIDASTGNLTESKIESNVFAVAGAQAALTLTGWKLAIRNNDFIKNFAGGPTIVEITIPAGTDINSVVSGNTFIASAAGGASGTNTDSMFELIGAATATDGLSFRNNDAPNGGVFKGKKNMRWVDNKLNNCVIDFQSETGQYVIGGDMTGATLQNIPADIVFIGVQGQADRGGLAAIDYLVGTASAELSAEIVVGATPGGELGGTWASPTVDATHSGSAHHSNANDHPQSHTVASHSDTTATGAELNTLTGGGDVGALHNHGPTDVIWPAVQHVNSSGQGLASRYPTVDMDSTEKMSILGYIPDDFVSTTGVYLVMIPDATETVQADFYIDANKVNETAGSTSKTSLNKTKAVTISRITEWDITSYMPSYAKGDYIGIDINSDTTLIRVIGVRFRYTR